MVATPQKIQDLEVVDIPIDEIKVSNRLRAISEEKVDELVESIQLVGMLHPLVVSKQENGYRLWSGNHRISALRKLNRKTAPCTLHVSDETVGKLVEVTENLIRSELCQISICQHIVIREELFTKLGKRAKSGDHRWNKTGITNDQLAKSMSMDRRGYLRKKSVAKNLHQDVQDLLIGTEHAKTFSDILALSKENNDVQLMVANLLVEGKCKGFKRALTLARIKCHSFNWSEEQTRIKDLIGNPYSVMKCDGKESELSKLCKIVSHNENQIIKREWGTETAPLAAQHPDHAAHFINFYSKEGDTCADVMCGRGTSILVGSALGRKMIGYDLSDQNLKSIRSTVLEHTNAKDSDLTLHHSDGIELTEYKGQESIWDMVIFDPPYIFQPENYQSNDERELGNFRDLDQFNSKLEICLKNLKRLVKPSSWKKKEFHPIVIKVGSARKSSKGLICMSTEVENISRKLNLTIHDKVISVLDSQFAMFNISRCIDHKYSCKIHETTLVLIKY